MHGTGSARHPLADLISAAAVGRFPPSDGGWRRVQPWREGLEAVVAFTGHAVLAVEDDVLDARLVELGVDGFGGAHDPRLVAALAGPDGWVDSLDALLVGRGRGRPSEPPSLVPRPDLGGHARVRRAVELRDDVAVLGREDGSDAVLAVVSRGVAGLRELSFEVEPDHRGGAGTSLIRGALTHVPAGELVVAAVAPGNAASLRALLAADFVPVGSLQLFRRGPGQR